MREPVCVPAPKAGKKVKRKKKRGTSKKASSGAAVGGARSSSIETGHEGSQIMHSTHDMDMGLGFNSMSIGSLGGDLPNYGSLTDACPAAGGGADMPASGPAYEAEGEVAGRALSAATAASNAKENSGNGSCVSGKGGVSMSGSKSSKAASRKRGGTGTGVGTGAGGRAAAAALLERKRDPRSERVLQERIERASNAANAFR